MSHVIFLTAAFLAGAAAGVLVLFRIGTSHEDPGTLTGEPPTRAAAAARRLSGLYARTAALPTGHDGECPDVRQ